jgi:acyl dehydratase
MTPAPAATATTQQIAAAPATLPLLIRAALPALPGVARLPGVRRTGTGTGLPDLVLQRSGVTIDRAHVAAYGRVCGFPLTDAVPATYPHVLAFRLQLVLMTDPMFPFPPMGLVHLDNTITQHRPVTADEVLDLRVHAAAMRPHGKGTLVDLVSTASSGDELVWEETTTLLARGRGDHSSGQSMSAESAARARPAPTGPVTWRLPADLGRRYAAVSGDLNPIHLYGVTARAFGFRGQIAHGMWTKARCLAALPGRVPDAFTVEVAFKKPLRLPNVAQFGVAPASDGALRFGVTSAPGGEHLSGLLTPLS